MSDTDAPVEIGVIARAHGVRGELRVHLHNPESTALSAADSIYIGDQRHPLETVRAVNKAFLIRVEGLNDRTAAERLKGEPVSVDREHLGLDGDDVLLTELIGLRAQLADGSHWGEVVGLETGPQVRLIIRREHSVCELPLVDAFVLSVDADGKTMVVDPPEGLPENEE